MFSLIADEHSLQDFFRLIERHALRAVIETTVQQKAVHHLMSRDLKGGKYEQNGDWRGATNCR